MYFTALIKCQNKTSKQMNNLNKIKSLIETREWLWQKEKPVNIFVYWTNL